MATASEFRHVAAVIDETRRRLAAIGDELGSLPHARALVGPPRTAVEATIGVTLANLRAATADLDEQFAEAHRRAAVCDHYTEAYRRFLRSDAANDAVAAPQRSASWVSYG